MKEVELMFFSDVFVSFSFVVLGAAPSQARSGKGFSKGLDLLTQCSVKANI